MAPQLEVLQEAFDNNRLRLQQAAPLENPEMVLVLDVAGSVADLARAVEIVPGLEWLVDLVQDQIPPDDDFYFAKEGDRDKPIGRQIYLLGTNQQALNQLLALWQRYQQAPHEPFARGLAPLKHVFEQLREIRPWDHRDRVGPDILQEWQWLIESDQQSHRFEVEAWHSTSAAWNQAASREINRLVAAEGGRILASTLLSQIAYHGFLVELPVESIDKVLRGELTDLVLSDRIMFFRPRAQTISDAQVEEGATPIPPAQAAPRRPPVVALLDGLPLANHTLLAGHLQIDDPDNWEQNYEAKDRLHGTAMSSLLLYGEGDAAAPMPDRQLYVRPIMRPDPADFSDRRTEHTPDDVLLIDLIHRAVRRICVGEADQGPVAPTIKIINLSMGDPKRIFAREMSPWARLLDWLAFQHSLLFIVSAGNCKDELTLATPRDSLGGMSVEDRQQLATAALLQDETSRRLMSPGESINALTVGALHMDASVPARMPANRYDLFTSGGLSPYTRIGHGYRRSIKPDLLAPGGRMLHLEGYAGALDKTTVQGLSITTAPGHKVAVPPMPGGSLDQTTYSRGTSNAAALTSRVAAQAHEVLEQLRQGNQAMFGPEYDAVMIKAMLVHGTSWGTLSDSLIALKPELSHIRDANAKRVAEKDYLQRWLGYGALNEDRTLSCIDERATLLGVGQLAEDSAVLFSAALPPSLGGRREWRRLTVTLAWLSPTNSKNQRYRRAKLWLSQMDKELDVKRVNSVHHDAAQRGTVQHEVLEGERALAFLDGDVFTCKVNCAADAGGFEGEIRFALCVSLEVAIGSPVRVYEEIRQRVTPLVDIRPGG
ncbi:MAG: S8 family peptidase [Stenotrophomonas sp.]